MESLKSTTIRGVGWSFVDNVLNSGISFVVGLVLARILSPAEFGIIGMTAVFIAVANTIIDSGFPNALIRKTDATQTDYNTVFYFNLATSFGLYALLCLSSPAIASFFNQPQLAVILPVLGLVLIINAGAIIQRTLLIKKVDFKTQTKVSVVASTGSALVGIGMALAGYGVWSLVGYQVARQTLTTLLFWMLGVWRPTRVVSRRSFNEMFGFGSKLLLSGLIDTIYRNIYYIVIGRFYSAWLLGQFTRAEQFSQIFSNNLTVVVQRVSYPVLSMIQDDPARLKDAYRKVIKHTTLVAFSAMLGLFAVAKPLILILIGEKWEEAIGLLQILCLSGMLYPLHAINLNILQVKGRSDLYLKLEVIKKLIATVPVVVGVFFGIKLMLWLGVGASIIAYFLNSWYSAELIGYSTKAQLKDICPIIVVSFSVASVMWALSFIDLSIWLMLPLQCVVGLLMSVVIYERIKNKEYLEMKRLLISSFNNKTNG